MSGVLITIIKIIGITIASIFGLLLLVLALVLFVPIRYKGKVSKHADVNGNICISWLLHVVNIRIIYTKTGLKITGRIFGIPIYRQPSEKANKVKAEKPKESKATHKKRTETTGLMVTESEKAVESHTDTTQQVPTMNTVQSEDEQEKYDKCVKKADKCLNNSQHSSRQKQNTIKIILIKIKDKIITIINKVVQMAPKLYNKFISLNKLIRDIKIFWDDPINKKAIIYCKQSLVKLLKEIMPVKLKGSVVFGTGDPYNTGRILAILGVFYGKYGEAVTIVPDFTNTIIEGDLYFRGRIRLFTLGMICLKVIMNKDVKYLRTAAEKLKNEARETMAA